MKCHLPSADGQTYTSHESRLFHVNGDNHHAYFFTRFTWIYPQSFASYRQSQGDLWVYWWWEAQPQLWLHKNSGYMTAAGELWVAHTRTPHIIAFIFHGIKTLWIMIGYEQNRKCDRKLLRTICCEDLEDVFAYKESARNWSMTHFAKTKALDWESLHQSAIKDENLVIWTNNASQWGD